MNFLQLVQRLRQECGVGGSGPSTTVNQSGESKRLVDWINTAWMDVQQALPGSDWMRGTFTLTTTATDAEYTPADASLTDHREWDKASLKVYTTSTADEEEMIYVPYQSFREMYMVGTASAGRPVFFTVKPDKTLRLYPTPNATYTVYGEYHKAATELSGDTDTPEIPTEFHMAVVYRAMQKYARYNAAPEIYEDAKTEYKRIMTLVHINQFGEMELGGPLA